MNQSTLEVTTHNSTLIIITSTSMRLNKNKLHLTAFILASFASLPVHVSAVFEKGDKPSRIPGKLDDGQENLDYMVNFIDTISYKSFVESSNEVQAVTTVKSLSFMNTQVLRFPSEGDAEAWCAKRKDVNFCEKDERVHTMSETTPYGIGMVGALGIDYQADSGIKSCIIDTGYDLGHEDLPNDVDLLSGGGTCWPKPCNWDEDPHGHGTHVAGTMAALQDGATGVVGVVRNGQMPMHIERALGSDGSGNISDVLQSMHNCVGEGAKVINMSLGGGGSNTYTDYFASLEADVLFVAAAGNGGDGSYLFPASVDSNKMMSVACVDSSSTRCSFSQFNDQVDIAAPGFAVLSTTPGNNYAGYSGTSMSSPHVAAVAALIWSHHPDATAAEIRNALEVSAIQPPPYEQRERNNDLGWGIVNAERALSVLDGTFTYAPSLSPSPTVAPTVSQQPSGECMSFNLTIMTDMYPGETSWELFNPRGEVIFSSDEEDPLVNNTLHGFEKCIEMTCGYEDSFYEFVMKDSWGDGIIPPGYYKIHVDGDLIHYGGNFTFYEARTNFLSCTYEAPSLSPSPTVAPTVSHQPSGECMPFDLSILPDIYPGDISWELFNPRGEVIFSSDEEDPLFPDKIFVFRTCLGTYCGDDSEYQFVLKDSWGDGIISPGFYKVFLDGELLKENGGNYTEEEVTFSSCPTSAPTVSAPPSPAPIPVCTDSTDKFFYKFKDDGTTPKFRNCSFFEGKREGTKNKVCNTEAPPGIKHGSAKDVCPQTCGNCCDIEIEHLENEKANLKKEKEDLMKLVERYKYIVELYNIDV